MLGLLCWWVPGGFRYSCKRPKGSGTTRDSGSRCESGFGGFPHSGSPRGFPAVCAHWRYRLSLAKLLSPWPRTPARCRCDCVSKLRTCASSVIASAHLSRRSGISQPCSWTLRYLQGSSLFGRHYGASFLLVWISLCQTNIPSDPNSTGQAT